MEDTTSYTITRKGMRVFHVMKTFNIDLDMADLIVDAIEEADRRYDARKE